MERSFDTIESDPFLRALVGSSDDAIIGKTLDGTIISWNESAQRLYGYTRREIVGENISALVPLDRLGELEGLLASIRSGQTVRNLRTQRLRRNGTTVDVEITVSPVIDSDGHILGGSTIAHDLTSHLLQMSDLRDAERRADEALSTLRTLEASAPIGLGFVDREFRIVHANEMLATFSGSTVNDLIGCTVGEVVPDVWSQVEPIFRRVFRYGESAQNIEVTGESITEPGRRKSWLANYYPVKLLNEIIGVGMVVLDITERRHAEEVRSTAMKQLAEGVYTVDSNGCLTSMNEAASKMLGWSESDLIGRRVRDFVLAGAEAGSDVARGDLELLRVRQEGMNVRLENHAYRTRDGCILPISVSASPLIIGDIVEGAVVVFRDITEEMSQRVRIQRELDALTWVGRIREALDEDRMVLYSQPIVPLGDGHPSEELLIRMTGRDLELILPGSFLPVAEKYGLITEIDQWVLRQAVKRAALGLHVGVNVSAESIVSLDLVSFIAHELDTTGADPSNLVFEITETALMRDIEKGEAFARGVVGLGCAIALDDFGTGFGTFTHVKKLPIAFLKIDIEFVRDLVTSTANQHVVKAIVNLAQGFKCRTIAEGVEDEETRLLLLEFGVDFVQGFLFGRPEPT